MIEIKEDAWDIELTPENKVLDLKLKDVWHYRDLLLLLVRRDFVSFYKQTILGPLWFFPAALVYYYNLYFCFR